ncbi:MAG: hypothetical protein ABSB74_04460 [Tepidisphaeraceae bacterium]
MNRFFAGMLISGILVRVCVPAFGQMSPDEALQRLKDREAAATQPSIADLLEKISNLQRDKVDLQRQLDAANAQIKALQDQIAAAAAAPPATADKSNSDNGPLAGTPWHRIKIGMTEEEANAIKNTKPFGIYATTKSEGRNVKVVQWSRLSDDTLLCTITYTDGRISAIDY